MSHHTPLTSHIPHTSKKVTLLTSHISPQPPLPSPLATQTSSPPPSHCTCLSVPSRSRPSWRPPCSMPEIRGTSELRHPMGASSSPRLQRSRSQSHHRSSQVRPARHSLASPFRAQAQNASTLHGILYTIKSGCSMYSKIR